MPWQYSQSTGQLTQNGGAGVANGYSGNGNGRNNPAMEAMPNVGPAPAGRYTIGAPHNSNHTGAYTMNLDPEAGTDTHGRTAFRIHGDSVQHPGQASDGCIVLPLDARQRIWNSGDHEIEVTR